MVISKYLDSIEGTDNEAGLLKGMVSLTEQEAIAMLMDKPGIGDIFKSLAALGKSESIADFKQTEQYNVIKDWGITVYDIEKGMVSIYPGPKHLKRAFAFAAIVGAGVLLLKMYCKYKRGQKF